MTPWEMFVWGYEAGVRSGHALGYAEGVDVLRDALGLLATYELGRHPSFRELERIRATPRQPYDERTPEQIRADSFTSWGLVPTDLVSGQHGPAPLRESA